MESSGGGGNVVEAGQRRMTQRDLVLLLDAEARSFFNGRKIEFAERIDVVRKLGEHLREMFSDVVLLDPPKELMIENGEPVAQTEMWIRFTVHKALSEVCDHFDQQ